MAYTITRRIGGGTFGQAIGRTYPPRTHMLLALLLLAVWPMLCTAVHERVTLNTLRPTGQQAWGYYYNNQNVSTVQLLSSPQGRNEVASLLKDMQLHGATLWRFFVEIDDLLSGPSTVNITALQLVADALALAQQHNIRVLFCGNVLFHHETAAQWIINANDTITLAANELFWTAVAKAFCNTSQVFAFDLQNEPVWRWNNTVARCGGISGPLCFDFFYNRDAQWSWQRWVHSTYGNEHNLTLHWADYPEPGEDWNHIQIPDNPGLRPPAPVHRTRLRDYHSHMNALQYAWATRLTTAIRSSCPVIPITVGELFPGNSRAYPDLLDFYCAHIYPNPSLDTIEKLRLYYTKQWAQLPQNNKPAMLEEFFPLHGSPAISWTDYLQVVVNVTHARAIAYTTYYCPPPKFCSSWENIVAAYIRNHTLS